MTEFKRQRQFVKAVLHAGSGMFSMSVWTAHVLGTRCCVERDIWEGVQYAPICIGYNRVLFPEPNFAPRTRIRTNVESCVNLCSRFGSSDDREQWVRIWLSVEV
jgi:hypothetical protein